MGEILVSASGAETTIFADIDTDVVAATRQHFQFLQDRR
jgi:predicted amidohydrolase